MIYVGKVKCLYYDDRLVICLSVDQFAIDDGLSWQKI